MSASDVRAFLSRHGLLARRDLGQNFLVEPAIADRLVALAGVEPGDSVLEIGTGLGVMTLALARRAARVVTLDIDAGLVAGLRADAVLPETVELIHADALRFDLSGTIRSLPPPVRLVANLPYSITGPVLRRVLDLRALLVDWSVMVQTEVARRLLASHGSRVYGSLTVLHGLLVSLSREMDLAPGCFFPVPRVRSTFLRMTPLSRCAVGPDELASVERVVRGAFGHRRKTLRSALRGAGLGADVEAALARAEIDPRARAEDLPPERFLALARALAPREA